MSGGTTQTTQQQSQTQPWSQAIPMLTSILGQTGNANLGPTGAQTSAVNQIMGEAGGVPSYAGQGENTVSNLFGSNTTPQQNMISSAYGQGAGALQPMLSSNWMDPSTNPYLGPAMSTMNQDITNQIEGQFAAAGRPMGTNAAGTQALARGLSQGEAGLLTNEFNTLAGQQAGAASELPGLAVGSAGALTGQEQQELANEMQGIGASGMIPGMLTQPGTSALTAANLQAGLPIANLAQLEGLTVPIAQLGMQSSGTSTTQTQSPWYMQALSGGLGGLGLLGGTGAFGPNGWMGGFGGVGPTGPVQPTGLLGGLQNLFMFSDERVKEDIEPIGMLYDETPVFSYRYKGDPIPRIGLMAQDVETRRPDAVVNFPGTDLKMVDYGKATERARMIGMLADLDLAA